MSCVEVQAEAHRKTTNGEAAMEAEMQKSNKWPIGSFDEQINRKGRAPKSLMPCVHCNGTDRARSSPRGDTQDAH